MLKFDCLRYLKDKLFRIERSNRSIPCVLPIKGINLLNSEIYTNTLYEEIKAIEE